MEGKTIYFAIYALKILSKYGRVLERELFLNQRQKKDEVGDLSADSFSEIPT